MKLMFWKYKREESPVDRKYRLAEELSFLSDEDAREVVKYGRKGFHLAKNAPKGARKRREEDHE